MLKIWGRSDGLNVQKLMWCVGELGLDYERVDHGGTFGGNDEPWYRAMNPNGKVPTIDDDGFILWESHSIVRYLCEKHGGDLWPEDIHARANASKWMDWQLGTLRNSVMPIFYNLVRKTPAERDQRELQEAIDLAAEHYAILDQQLETSSYVAGEHLTMGDIPVGALTYRWLNMDFERPRMPHVVAWYERLSQRPAFREHVMHPLI